MTAVTDYNLLGLDERTMQDPYPFYRLLQNDDPVYREPEYGIYLVSRYVDIIEVERHPQLYSSISPTGPNSRPDMDKLPSDVRELVEQLLPGGELPALPVPEESDSPMAVRTLLAADPPEHTRYRGMLSRVLNIRRARQWEGRIREIANELVDSFAGRGEVEFVRDFAHPLPLRVVAELLGVPTDDYDLMQAMFGGENAGEAIGNPNAAIIRMAEMFKSGGLSQDAVFAMFGAGDPFVDYFGARIAELRNRPIEGDFLSDLVHASDSEGRQLTDTEILSIIGHFRVAGHETSTKMITAAMYYLLRSSRAMKAVQADLSLCENLVEESLRMEAPVQGLFRVATEDAVLGGVDVPAGSMLMLMFGAANRDAGQFDDPDVFDPSRENARSHLAFGHGAHFCVGAPFARAEGRIGFEVLFSRLTEFAFDGDRNDFERTVSYVLRGIKRLHLTFTPEAA